MSTPTNDSIVDKIRALLRKTEEAGATPAESASATQAAMRLMIKHGIDKMTVDSKEAEEAKRGHFEITKEYFKTGRDREKTDQYIARILQECFLVRVLWSCDYEWAEKTHKDAGWRSRYGYYKKRLCYLVVGDKEDVTMALSVIPEIHRIMRHLLARHIRETGKARTAVLEDSFYCGVYQGYAEANRIAKEETLLAAGKDTAGQYALVLIDKEKAARDYITENIQTVRAKTRGMRSSDTDDAAMDAGRTAGKNLNLRNRKLQ